jgi:acetylornithine deacetylase/succinyl-diaminopimelate desuccinylase-like protein
MMETGGTDGKALRSAAIPAYGASPIFGDIDDVRAHGRDERIRVDSFYEGLDYAYRLIRTLGN